MRKNLALLFLVVMSVIIFASCDSQVYDDSDEHDDTVENKEDNNGDILSSDIVFSSDFSEDFAIVSLKNDETNAYVIDKKGNIQFTFPLSEYRIPGFDIQYLRFVDGWMKYNENYYNKNGKILKPEDLGGTAFVDRAINENQKYILVEKITSDYSSAKKELGVFDAELELVSPFSEANYNLYHSDKDWLYEIISYKEGDGIKCNIVDDTVYTNDGRTLNKDDINVNSFDEYDSTEKYIVSRSDKGTGVLNLNFEWVYPESNEYHFFDIIEDYLYLSNWGSGYLCLNLLTGESSEVSEKIESHNTIHREDYSAITNYNSQSKSVNGNSAVLMYNGESGEWYYSVINKEIEFLFEPRKIELSYSSCRIEDFDGENLLLSSGGSFGVASKESNLELICCNIKTGEFNSFSTSNIEASFKSATLEANDGVIVFRLSNGQYSDYYRQSEVRYYTYDFEEILK